MTINSYNLSRSVLAFSTIITLLFNTNYVLFGLEFPSINNGIYNYNLFFILKDYLVIAKFISIIILLFVIYGIYPRITGLFHWYVTYSFFLSNDVVDGGDHIASNITLLLIPLTLLDNRVNHWSNNKLLWNNKTKKAIFNSFSFLLLLQVCVIYLHAFIGKLDVEEWKNGTAIYYWFTHNHFGVNPYFLTSTINILSNKLTVSLMTWSTLILEFILASCILLNQKDRLKRYRILMIGIFFHFSILIIHGLVSFFFVMASALIIYLMPFKDNFYFTNLKFKKLWSQFTKLF